MTDEPEACGGMRAEQEAPHTTNLFTKVFIQLFAQVFTTVFTNIFTTVFTNVFTEVFTINITFFIDIDQTVTILMRILDVI